MCGNQRAHSDLQPTKPRKTCQQTRPRTHSGAQPTRPRTHIISKPFIWLKTRCAGTEKTTHTKQGENSRRKKQTVKQNTASQRRARGDSSGEIPTTILNQNPSKGALRPSPGETSRDTKHSDAQPAEPWRRQTTAGALRRPTDQAQNPHNHKTLSG